MKTFRCFGLTPRTSWGYPATERDAAASTRRELFATLYNMSQEHFSRIEYRTNHIIVLFRGGRHVRGHCDDHLVRSENNRTDNLSHAKKADVDVSRA
jgi:hypothetical protein